jgi:hypothetical protein
MPKHGHAQLSATPSSPSSWRPFTPFPLPLFGQKLRYWSAELHNIVLGFSTFSIQGLEELDLAALLESWPGGTSLPASAPRAWQEVLMGVAAKVTVVAAVVAALQTMPGAGLPGARVACRMLDLLRRLDAGDSAPLQRYVKSAGAEQLTAHTTASGSRR